MTREKEKGSEEQRRRKRCSSSPWFCEKPATTFALDTNSFFSAPQVGQRQSGGRSWVRGCAGACQEACLARDHRSLRGAPTTRLEQRSLSHRVFRVAQLGLVDVLAALALGASAAHHRKALHKVRVLSGQHALARTRLRTLHALPLRPTAHNQASVPVRHTQACGARRAAQRTRAHAAAATRKRHAAAGRRTAAHRSHKRSAERVCVQAFTAFYGSTAFVRSIVVVRSSVLLNLRTPDASASQCRRRCCRRSRSRSRPRRRARARSLRGPQL